MRATHFTFFMSLVALLFTFNTANASTRISEGEAREAMVKKMMDDKTSFSMSAKMEKKVAKLAQKFQKRIAKFERLFGKSSNAGVDFNDPVQKWLWFGLLGWLAGALLYSLGWFIAAPFWYLGYLCWLAGTICIVIWILKKTGNM